MVMQERLDRNKDTQEFFTPAHIVAELVAEVPDEYFVDLKPFRETACGNGNIAIQVIEKFKNYHSLDNILANVQLSDIMLDNCIECIERICGKVNIVPVAPPADKEFDGLIKMFKINDMLVDWIVQADGTKFTWWQQTTQQELFKNLFEEIPNKIDPR